MYPNGENPPGYDGVGHTQQTSSPLVANGVKNILHNNFGIVFGTPGTPPSGSWNVAIYGPSSAQPGNSCYWYASTNVQDASYEWRVNGSVVSSGQDLWLGVSDSFTLELYVWNNSTGAGGSASISVNVSYSNQQCLVE